MGTPREPQETLHGWMERWSAKAPKRIAVSTGAERITYAELNRRAISLAGFFHELGLGRGDVIAAQSPNGAEFLSAYLASGYLGATLQTIHMPYRESEIETLLSHSGAKAVICLARTRDFTPARTMLALRVRLPSLAHVISLGDVPLGAVAFPSADEDRPLPAVPRPTADDRFLLLHTSGTSAAPKAVPVPYRKFLSNARLSAIELRLTPSSILMTAAPFTHLYGLFTLHLALAVGGTTAILPGFTPEALAGALDEHRPTALFVAPAHLAACHQAGLLTERRLASLTLLQISGSACPYALAKAVQQLMPDGEVHQLWGMSELQAGAFTRPGDEPELRLRSAGRASPLTQLRIAGGPGGEGELQVKGPSVFDAYLADETASAAAFTDDLWFRSGDLACMDADGNIRITGRVKDLINRGGVKFNPVDVEVMIAGHPKVAQCAIVPMPDPVLGERACVCIVPRDAAQPPRLEEICGLLQAQKVAKTRWPEHLLLVTEMPMTPTRKIIKGELTRLITTRLAEMARDLE
jgi:cyclohexanecarboxylate-CoA ligase/acyl-CoA synthetase